jgi:hypothetical protein
VVVVSEPYNSRTWVCRCCRWLLAASNVRKSSTPKSECANALSSRRFMTSLTCAFQCFGPGDSQVCKAVNLHQTLRLLNDKCQSMMACGPEARGIRCTYQQRVSCGLCNSLLCNDRASKRGREAGARTACGTKRLLRSGSVLMGPSKEAAGGRVVRRVGMLIG